MILGSKIRLGGAVFAASAAATALGLFGCGDHHHDKVVVHETRPVVIERERPRDVVVVEKERAPSVVYVREAPPAVIIEKRPRLPGPDYVWIGGCWGHDGRKYVWSAGHYERVRRGYVYAEPRWVRTDRGWYREDGGWRTSRRR